MKVIGIIRPTETREIEAEAVDFTAARAKLEAEIPEGYQLIALRQA